jgi:hypothetical protein
MEKNQARLDDKFIEIVGYIAIAPFFILFISSIGIIAYQIIIFAITGNWESISIANLSNFDWIQNKLLGVYKILTWLPASLTLFVLSWIFLFVAIYFVSLIAKK